MAFFPNVTFSLRPCQNISKKGCLSEIIQKCHFLEKLKLEGRKKGKQGNNNNNNKNNKNNAKLSNKSQRAKTFKTTFCSAIYLPFSQYSLIQNKQ